jgi:ubiquinone/menaquinone biosynthesis C-methylase UbiE
MAKENRHIEFFNGLADEWDSMFEPAPEEQLLAIASLAKLKKSARVLDAGCGTGIMIPALMRFVGENGKIYALDPAEMMLKKLRSKFRQKAVETRCETLEDCTIPSGSLDAVVCFSCFPHIADKPKAVANAARMLKKGGIMAIAHMSSRNEINEYHSRCSKTVKNDLLPADAEMKDMLNQAGLKVESFRDEKGRYEVVAVKLAHPRH